MTNLQEVTGVDFEIALAKFQQDLEDITRNQKTEVSLFCLPSVMHVTKTFSFEFPFSLRTEETYRKSSIFLAS